MNNYELFCRNCRSHEPIEPVEGSTTFVPPQQHHGHLGMVFETRPGENVEETFWRWFAIPEYLD